MRHAKVLIENRKIYANELKECIEEYDKAPIETKIQNREELVALANSCNYIVSSGLPRSIESLALLGKKAHYIDELFAEVESPYMEQKIVKLSLFTWGFWFKIAWFLGYSNKSKSYKYSKEEAKEGAKLLIDFAKEHGSVLLVGHGLKNILIVKSLKKLGSKEEKKISSKNFGYGVYY